MVSCSDKKKDEPKIRLVLQITIDGLRGDLIMRYQSGFTEGGFNYLLNNGTYFTNAHYQHANTETIVGHTTLATGAQPAVHGMVGNVWYDSETDEIGYNIEDPLSPILPTRSTIVEGAQVDPAQKASRTKGRSPRAIIGTTVSEEIFEGTKGKAKIFGVSGKDRSAVSMAGSKGKAFWYSTDTGDFVTSTYYYDQYPDWVSIWNLQGQAEKASGTNWSLLNEATSYQFIEQDDRPYEIDLKGYGRVFPHAFGESEHPLFFTRVLVSPLGDQLTLDFSKTLIENETLGKDEIVDYLSISFSGVDAVNHFFGPSSLENEDIVLQLDKTLKELFAYIDKKIGLDHTLIVLSADHGMAEMPEYMNEKGLQVGRIYSEDIIDRVNQIGRDQFGIDSIAKLFFRPSLYLDEDKIVEAGLEMNTAEKHIAEALTKTSGIYLALAKSDINTDLKDDVAIKIRNNFHPDRSGNIYVAQDPYWFLFERGPIGVMHGSPWDYDNHVPIIFSGPGINTLSVDRLVHPVDIAPTMSSYLGVNTPSKSTGVVLDEINN